MHDTPLKNLFGDDFRFVGQLVGTCLEGHHDFFECGVAGTLSEAVHADLDLPGAGLHARQAVGDGETEIVMAVR